MLWSHRIKKPFDVNMMLSKQHRTEMRRRGRRLFMKTQSQDVGRLVPRQPPLVFEVRCENYQN